MSEMVERIRAAMVKAELEMADPVGPSYEELARIAIEAMREPTEAMIDAAADAKKEHNGDWPGGTENEPCALDPSGEQYWRTMIDAALAHK